MSRHVSSCVLTANELPAFVGNVARSRTSPLVANQIRDALVHSRHSRHKVSTSLGGKPREAGVQISKLSREMPGMPRYEAESVVVWVRGV